MSMNPNGNETRATAQDIDDLMSIFGQDWSELLPQRPMPASLREENEIFAVVVGSVFGTDAHDAAEYDGYVLSPRFFWADYPPATPIHDAGHASGEHGWCDCGV